MTADPAALAAEKSAVALRRAVVVARVSAWTLLVLGAASALVSVRQPWSPGFAISLAVIVNGALELHGARQLVALRPKALRLLAWNQIALGLEIAAYGVGQGLTLDAAAIQRVMARPFITGVLQNFPPEDVAALFEMLVPAVRVLYVIVGALGFLGCAGAAWYYVSRRRHLRVLVGPPLETP